MADKIRIDVLKKETGVATNLSTIYYFDKVILADKVPVDEDELTDFIDGILER